jgi:hypothetical protein
VGIPEARHAVGILQDVNQVLVTVQARPTGTAPGLTNEDVTNSGRGFCYSYRYALCSTSGFSPGAQAYALAHHVALLDLSHQEYDELRSAIDAVGDALHDYIERMERTSIASAAPRGRLLRQICATLRRELWALSLADTEGAESKMESNGRAGMEKSLCGNGLLQASIPPAPASHSGLH